MNIRPHNVTSQKAATGTVAAVTKSPLSLKLLSSVSGGESDYVHLRTGDDACTNMRRTLSGLTQLHTRTLAWHSGGTRISRVLDNLPKSLQSKPGYNAVNIISVHKQQASGSILIAVLEVPDSHPHRDSEQPNIYRVFPQCLEGNSFI
jgi:hypothetical protein